MDESMDGGMRTTGLVSVLLTIMSSAGEGGSRVSGSWWSMVEVERVDEVAGVDQEVAMG